jgi:hypothetical protein
LGIVKTGKLKNTIMCNFAGGEEKYSLFVFTMAELNSDVSSFPSGESLSLNWKDGIPLLGLLSSIGNSISECGEGGLESKLGRTSFNVFMTPVNFFAN